MASTDCRDHGGVGDWLFARTLAWRLGVQVVAIDPSAAFRKVLRMWLPRTAVAVDHLHLVSLGNQAMTEPPSEPVLAGQGAPWPRRRQGLGPPDAAPAYRRHAVRDGAHRLEEVLTADDEAGKLQAVWKVEDQLRALLRTDSLADAAAAKEELKLLVDAAGRPETSKLYRTVWRWWIEIEVLIVTYATTAKVEANSTGIKNIKRTARGDRNAGNYKSISS